jgi:DNA replication and repair protein RecF
MILERISVINYRNVIQADLSFCKGINCFVGDNGAGKTNLLDAIYYLSFCKSFLNPLDAHNIRHNESFFMIQGTYLKNDSQEEVLCGLKSGQKKQFKRNKKEYQKLSEHIGFLPLVIISPADEQIINEGSEMRRKLMDSIISQYDKRYLDDLVRYGRILLQRNQLLKDFSDGKLASIEVLDALDMQLATVAAAIYKVRLAFVEEFLPVFNSHFLDISSGAENVEMKYVSHLDRGDFNAQLLEIRKRDMVLGYSTRGIHKDDLEFYIDGYPLKREGSQGQKKSFAICLKLAQFDFLARHQGVKPILLLDDIFDKLDFQRSKSLMRLVAENHFNQIFITHTQRGILMRILSELGKEYKIFEVEKGEVSET